MYWWIYLLSQLALKQNKYCFKYQDLYDLEHKENVTILAYQTKYS